MNASLADLNRAFWDLGLRFSWDEATYAKLASLPDLRAQLFRYLQDNHPHLLGVYDVEFEVDGAVGFLLVVRTGHQEVVRAVDLPVPRGNDFRVGAAEE